MKHERIKVQDFKVEKHGPIIIFKSPDHQLHNKAFVRIQEFYESTFPEIKGQQFELSLLKKLYKKKYGAWSYYTDWQGHNIDSDTLIDFYAAFSDLSYFEDDLLSWLCREQIGVKARNFCIIACNDADHQTRYHEIAHAFWYLYPAYKKQMLRLISQSQRHSKMFSYLYKNLSKDYTPDAIYDEMHAYTAAMRDMHEFCVGCKVDTRHVDVDVIVKMQALFKRYMDKYGFV